MKITLKKEKRKKYLFDKHQQTKNWKVAKSDISKEFFFHLCTEEL